MEEKKVTLRLNMSNHLHEKIYDKITRRDRNRYRSITDYICAAVAAFEGEPQALRLTEEDRRMLCEEIIESLRAERFGDEAQPGL